MVSLWVNDCWLVNFKLLSYREVTSFCHWFDDDHLLTPFSFSRPGTIWHSIHYHRIIGSSYWSMISSPEIPTLCQQNIEYMTPKIAIFSLLIQQPPHISGLIGHPMVTIMSPPCHRFHLHRLSSPMIQWNMISNTLNGDPEDLKWYFHVYLSLLSIIILSIGGILPSVFLSTILLPVFSNDKILHFRLLIMCLWFFISCLFFVSPWP